MKTSLILWFNEQTDKVEADEKEGFRVIQNKVLLIKSQMTYHTIHTDMRVHWVQS